MDQPSLPTNENAHILCIPLIWSTIEACLDLPDLIQMSRSCKVLHSMHSTIIDEETGKIKIRDFSFRQDPDIPMRYKTTYFLLGALNAVHFQSLHSIHLDLSAIRDEFFDEGVVMRHQAARVEAALTCFPIFVVLIAEAKNLESLYFDPDAAIDKYGFESSLFQLLGKNLALCKKLRELEIVNGYLQHRSHPERPWEYGGTDVFYSYALTSALTPVLRVAKDTLESFTYKVGDHFTGFNCSRRILSANETHSLEVAGYFLIALLSCTRLHTCHIAAVGYAADEFLDTSEDELQSFSCGSANHLTKLHLNIQPSSGLNSMPDRTTFVPLVRHFSNCNTLEDICLSFNEILWRKGTNKDEAAALLATQNNLSSLAINCGNISDDLDMMGMIEDGCRHNLETLNELEIYGLNSVSGSRLYALVDDLDDAGISFVDAGISPPEFQYERGRRPDSDIEVGYFVMRRVEEVQHE